MHPDTSKYNARQQAGDRQICDLLARLADQHLPEAGNKLWHGHPVWFLDGNRSSATAGRSRGYG